MKTYPLFKVHVPVDEALAKIREVLESGFINEGVQVTQLTEAMKEGLDTENLVLTNSCTSALTMALHLAGVRPGDDVITTPMTCVATNTPITTMGANIVWADIDPTHGMIDPRDVVRKITPKTKAVMAVAWAGTPPELVSLLELCRRRGIKLILDAAHAFGAHYEGEPVHRWADFTCYSFQAIKHVTTGDGGALVCTDNEDHRRSKALKWFGLDRDRAKDEKGDWKGQQWDVDILEAGYKFNMNNVAAAIGLAQLDYIDDILGSHRVNAALYDTLFRDTQSVKPATRPDGAHSSFWVYPMTIDLEFCGVSRDSLLKLLNNEGIMAGIVHVPNDTYTAFDSSLTHLPGTRVFSSTQFALPCGWWLTEDDIHHIARRVKELSR